MSLQVGDVAPEIHLPDQEGNIHSLVQHKGSWILLYFYPKDDTPGCTKEACAIRDKYSDFSKSDIIVLGVSVDSISSHVKFREKFKLPFTLLSDEEKEVVNLYGVWGRKKFMGREYMGTNRMSFLINPQGKIVKIYEDVKPEKHAQEVLHDVQELRNV